MPRELFCRAADKLPCIIPQEPVGVGAAARGPLGVRVARNRSTVRMRSPGTGELFHSYLGTVNIFVPFLMVPTKSPLPHLAVWLKTELSDLAFLPSMQRA